jgi:hypothetical protein
MAKVEVEWVSFGRGVRLGGSSTEAAACARSGSVNIYKVSGDDGVCLSIEETGKPPIVVPWHSVGSIVYRLVDAPAPVKAHGKKAVEASP